MKIFEIAGHQLQDALIVGAFVIALQAKQGDHVGPQVFAARQVGGRAGAALIRAKPAVGLPTVEDAVDPDLRFLVHARVVEQVAAEHEALEPVGHFLPAVLAGAGLAEPGVFLFFEESADLHEMAVETFALQLELLTQPAFGPHGAHGQFDEGAGARGGRLAR